MLTQTSESNNLISSPASQKDNQIQLAQTIIIHENKSGINPLADAAAKLFSLATKYGQLENCLDFEKIQTKLINEINLFQDNIKNQGYNAEYILISRYALCVTFDDILSHTEWGTDGKWEPYNLLQIFNQEESGRQERFFLILERLIKEPKNYIELMEFMYLCISLGFKGNYRATGFNHTQLEMICDTLYQHIRAYRGEFNKTLSPFSITSTSHKNKIINKKFSPTTLLLTTACLILLIFIGLNYALDTSAHHVDRTLIQIGKAISHESINV